MFYAPPSARVAIRTQVRAGTAHRGLSRAVDTAGRAGQSRPSWQRSSLLCRDHRHVEPNRGDRGEQRGDF